MDSEDKRRAAEAAAEQENAKRSVELNRAALVALFAERPSIFIRAVDTANSTRGQVQLLSNNSLVFIAENGGTTDIANAPPDRFILTSDSYKLIDPRFRQQEANLVEDKFPNPLLQKRPGPELVELWEAGEDFSVAGILTGPPAAEGRERKRPRDIFQQELTAAFRAGIGRWSSSKKSYSLSCSDPHHLARLAEKANLTVVRIPISQFGEIEFLTDGNYFIGNALDRSGRNDIRHILSQHDSTRIRGGIGGLVFDFHNDRLIVVNGEKALELQQK